MVQSSGRMLTASEASRLSARERTISSDFGIDLRGRLNKSRLTSNSFAESSSCQDNVVKRPPNAGRVASLNSKTPTCPLLSSASRSIARSDRSTSGNASWRKRLQHPPLSFVYKPLDPSSNRYRNQTPFRDHDLHTANGCQLACRNTRTSLLSDARNQPRGPNLSSC